MVLLDRLNMIESITSGCDQDEEERVRKSKIIPGYEKYRFRGQLLALAELGVMPNDYQKPLYDGFTPFKECCEIKTPFKGSARSDVTPPLAYWRGDRPLDEERLNQLFGRYL